MNTQDLQQIVRPTKVNGLDNILLVAPFNSSLGRTWLAEFNGRVHNSLQGAINALPGGDGVSTFGYNHSIIVFAGQDEIITEPIVVPLSKSGVTIVGLMGSKLISDSDLGFGNALLQIEAHDTTVSNMTFSSVAAKQTGTAIQIGSKNGAGLSSIIIDCIILGSESGAYSSFQKGISIHDGTHTQIDNTLIRGDKNTSEGINIKGKGRGILIKDTVVHITHNANTTALAVEEGSDNGMIFNSHFTVDGKESTNIEGKDWLTT